MRRVAILALVLAGLLLAPLAASSQIPLSGRIELPTGAPAVGVEVELLPLLDLYELGLVVLAGKARPDPAVVTSTREDGTFRLEAPAAGFWQLRVAPKGHMPVGLSLLPLLEERIVPPLELTAEETLKLKLTAADGMPLVAARVVASPARSDQHPWQPTLRRALTDDQGVARLGRLAGEQFQLFAFAPGYLEGERTAGRERSTTLSLTPAVAKPLRLLAESGQPVARALVRLGERHWRLGVTDNEGLLQIPLPNDGEVLIQAIDERGRRLQSLEDVAGWTTEEPRVLTLEEPFPWNGQVVDRESGKGLPGTLVWRGGQPADFVVADSSGNYSLPGPEEDNIWIWAAAPGYLRKMEHSRATAGSGPTLSLQKAIRATGVVVDNQDRPVADVDIGVQIDLRSGGRWARRARHEVEQGRSDLRGQFSIGSLHPDLSYVFRATRRGYAPTFAALPNPRNDTRAPLRIVLETGRVATGTVVDVDGAPIAGALVQLAESTASDSPRELFAYKRDGYSVVEAYSDQHGRFSLPDLPAADFELHASATGYAPTLISPVKVPETESAASLGEITLKPGLTIEGQAVDSGGSAIEGASVYATEIADQMRSSHFRSRSANEPVTTTDANGFFTVPDRSEGEQVELMVRKSGFADGNVPGLEVPTYKPVTVRLYRASKITGTVVDSNGRGVPEAYVYVHSMTGMSRLGPALPNDGITDESGAFVVEETPVGQILLSVSAEGYRDADVTHLAVEPEQDLDDVRVELQRGAALTGRVTDPMGRPLGEASVMHREPSSSRGTGTDSQGFYRIEGIPTGHRLIVAHHEDYAEVSRRVEVVHGENTLDISLEPGATVSGRVLTEAGEPVTGARVSVWSTSDNRWRDARQEVSDTTGSFEVRGLSEGAHSVSVQKEGFAQASPEDLEVGPGGIRGLEIRLTPGATLTGRLTGLETQDYSNVHISARSESGPHGDGRGQADGFYVVKNLAPGRYNVVASLDSRRTRGEMVTIVPGDKEVALDLVFSEGLTLTGQVLRDSEPLVGGYVSASGLEVSTRAASPTDSEGRFRLIGLEPGRLLLQVSSGYSGVGYREEVDLTSDQEILLRFDTARVSGVVLDAGDSQPINRATVRLELLGSPSTTRTVSRSSAESDSSGHFRFTGTSAGNYRLVISKEGYAPAVTQLTVNDGLDQDGLEVSLTPTEGVRVVVTLPSGQPAVEFRAAVVDASGLPLTVTSHVADLSGGARINAPPGRWELWLRGSSGTVATTWVDVPSEPVAIRLNEAAQLRVRVPELEGDPTLATVTVIGTDGRRNHGPQWMDSYREPRLRSGSSQLASLLPGTYTVVVEASDGRAWQAQVSLGSGENPELILQ